MSKSPELAQKIFQAREDDQVHLLLCDALFQFQLWRSPQCHAHLEQPVYQEELAAILEHAWIAVCDMCRAGQLKHPVSGKLIKKGTQILTTSQIMKHTVEGLRRTRNHEHDTIAGSFHHPGMGRINVSQYSELYTRVFARKIARCLQCIGQIRETAEMSPEHVMTSQALEHPEQPEAKRQKLLGKQSPPMFYQQQQVNQEREGFLQAALQQAPRVGKRVFSHGSIWQSAQDLFPHMIVKAVEVCKGADKYRPPCEGITKQNATHRITLGIHRHQTGHFCDETWENWTTLTRKQLLRKGPPARLMVTIFGNPVSTSPVSASSMPVSNNET